MKIKKWKDGSYRKGRKKVFQTMFGLWVYKTTGRLVVDVKKTSQG